MCRICTTNVETDCLSSLSDEKLFSRYQAGESACFDIIYERRCEGVRSFFRKYLFTRYHEHVEDLTQMVFADLHRISPDLGNFSLYCWLMQSAESHAQDLVRRETSKKRYTGAADCSITEIDQPASTTPEDDLNRCEVVQAVQDMVHRLRPDEQEAMQLKMQGLSRREAAKELGVTPGQYQCLLARGLLSLQGMTSTRLEATIV